MEVLNAIFNRRKSKIKQKIQPDTNYLNFKERKQNYIFRIKMFGSYIIYLNIVALILSKLMKIEIK